MVDDDEQLCELMKEFLAREGYEVTAMNDGASGLRAALNGGFALAILDVMLPMLLTHPTRPAVVHDCW